VVAHPLHGTGFVLTLRRHRLSLYLLAAQVQRPAAVLDALLDSPRAVDAGEHVFCIGKAKTGTTSLAAALRSLGYQVGDQAEAELLIDDWAVRDFRRIVRHCESADAFQDVPFSLAYTYCALDQAFPGARFILTVRRTADEWFESLKRFHISLAGSGGLPTPADLKALTYRQPGWIWKTFVLEYGDDDSTLYDRDRFIHNYEAHRQNVTEYFRHRPNDLLVLDISEPTAMDSFSGFLGLNADGLAMPHLNRTR